MAMVVENGSGLSNSNSYLSVADFQSYHDDRGGDYSAYDSDAISQALVRATDYIERRFKMSFVGYRRLVNQSLSWPRVSAYYRDGRAALDVPVEVRQATAEYAMRSLVADLAPDPTYDDTNAAVESREEQVGPIVEKYTFANSGATSSFRKYPLADSLLRELTMSGRYMQRV